VQGGYGAFFAGLVQSFVSITSVAPKALTEAQQASGVQRFKLRANERFDSRSFSEGWCPGARAITNLS